MNKDFPEYSVLEGIKNGEEVEEVLEKYSAKLIEVLPSSTLRRFGWSFIALSALRDDYSPEEIESAKSAGKFIEAEKLSSIEPGDNYEVDYILMSLRAAGFNAGYANVIVTHVLTISVLYMGIEKLGIVSRRSGDSMVEEWDGSMCEVPCILDEDRE